MTIAPSPYRRTTIVTHWPGGEVTLSACLLDATVQVAILSRKRHGARVPYIIRCRYKVTREPEASILLKSSAPLSHET